MAAPVAKVGQEARAALAAQVETVCIAIVRYQAVRAMVETGATVELPARAELAATEATVVTAAMLATSP